MNPATELPERIADLADSVLPRWREILQYKWTVLRSGLMAAETGDMSSIPGHIIPCLALGIPGSAPSAVLMAAMIIPPYRRSAFQ